MPVLRGLDLDEVNGGGDTTLTSPSSLQEGVCWGRLAGWPTFSSSSPPSFQPAWGMPLGLPTGWGGDRLEASRDLGGGEMLLKK